ncbi:MAG: extracellular solute-binding protein [Bifidobacteriaceae bacterium]|jgi:ABC-type glycerol-3-phosphate transport system substrate-binding protein|nr:extracellular solute-binding protein [Bifidobacteriaceae bacterium]
MKRKSTKFPRTVGLILTTGLLSFGTLAACGDGDGAATGGGCQLTFLASADRPQAEQDGWKEVLAEFSSEYDCEVTAEFQGAWDEITQQVTAAQIAHEPIDLFITSTATRDLAKAGLIMSLDNCIAGFEDRFIDSAMEPYNFGSKQWAVPMSSTDTSAIVYNADMFKELGIDPPTTYEELVAAGKTIRDAKGIVPMLHQGSSPWYWGMWFFGAFGQESGNQSVQRTEDFLKGERRFDSPEEIAALADLAKFTEDGLLDQTTMATDLEGMRAALVQGKTAMIYVLTPELINLRAAGPDFEIGIFQFPRVLSDPAIRQEVGGGPENGLAIASFTEPDNLEAACQLVEYVSRPGGAASILEPIEPLVPSVKSVPVTQTEPLAPQLNSQFIPNTVEFLDWIWPGQINDAVRDAITGVMFDGVDPAEAAAAVQEAFDRLVAEEDYQFDWWADWDGAQWAKVEFPSGMKIEVG